MRGINYLAAFGTILLFIGFYCLKAAFQKNINSHGSKPKPSNKLLLISGGLLAIAAGIFLIVKALMKISN